MGFRESLCPWSPARKRWCWDPVLVSLAQGSPSSDAQSQAPYPEGRGSLLRLYGSGFAEGRRSCGRKLQEGGASSLPSWMQSLRTWVLPSLWVRADERECQWAGGGTCHLLASQGWSWDDGPWFTPTAPQAMPCGVVSLCGSVGHQRAQRPVQRSEPDSQEGKGFPRPCSKLGPPQGPTSRPGLFCHTLSFLTAFTTPTCPPPRLAFSLAGDQSRGMSC